MVQRKISEFGKDFDSLCSHLTNAEVANLLIEYLFAKRKTAVQDEYMSPQSFVCWKAKELLERESQLERIKDNLVPLFPEQCIPPFMEDGMGEVWPPEWWEGVQHIATPLQKESPLIILNRHLDEAYNRHN